MFVDKKSSTSNFTKIQPVGAEMITCGRAADRQTGVTKRVVVAFRDFAKDPKRFQREVEASLT
jgi:hypothetical protein